MQVFRGYYTLIWPVVSHFSREPVCESISWNFSLPPGYLAAMHLFPNTSTPPSCSAVVQIVRSPIHTLRRTSLHGADTFIFVALFWNKYSKNPYETHLAFPGIRLYCRLKHSPCVGAGIKRALSLCQEHGCFLISGQWVTMGFYCLSTSYLTAQVLVKHRLRAEPDFPDH